MELGEFAAHYPGERLGRQDGLCVAEGECFCCFGWHAGSGLGSALDDELVVGVGKGFEGVLPGHDDEDPLAGRELGAAVEGTPMR